MKENKFDEDSNLEIDIDSLIRENAKAVADFESNENQRSYVCCSYDIYVSPFCFAFCP